MTCACAVHNDGFRNTMLCPAHAENDLCRTRAKVTGKRRTGSSPAPIRLEWSDSPCADDDVL